MLLILYTNTNPLDCNNKINASTYIYIYIYKRVYRDDLYIVNDDVRLSERIKNRVSDMRMGTAREESKTEEEEKHTEREMKKKKKIKED